MFSFYIAAPAYSVASLQPAQEFSKTQVFIAPDQRARRVLGLALISVTSLQTFLDLALAKVLRLRCASLRISAGGSDAAKSPQARAVAGLALMPLGHSTLVVLAHFLDATLQSSRPLDGADFVQPEGLWRVQSIYADGGEPNLGIRICAVFQHSSYNTPV
jgi:hypothetical protein